MTSCSGSLMSSLPQFFDVTCKNLPCLPHGDERVAGWQIGAEAGGNTMCTGHAIRSACWHHRQLGVSCANLNIAVNTDLECWEESLPVSVGKKVVQGLQ